jgi:hypothetical protein
MKTQKKRGNTSCGLSESIDQISNDLLFHPHPVLEKIWMDTGMVCELLGVSPRTLYTYTKKGMIKCKLSGGVNLYPATDVEILMKYLLMKRS